MCQVHKNLVKLLYKEFTHKTLVASVYKKSLKKQKCYKLTTQRNTM